ncbi:hypothetical protein HBH43_051590 [Parastagonospora nodorum]|nr:hypothetical protein HBH43_051590 [Parastagonospora nodorum]
MFPWYGDYYGATRASLMFTHTAWSANRACLIYAVHIINNVRCTQPHVLMYVSISPGSKMTLTGPVHAVVPLVCSVG